MGKEDNIRNNLSIRAEVMLCMWKKSLGYYFYVSVNSHMQGRRQAAYIPYSTTSNFPEINMIYPISRGLYNRQKDWLVADRIGIFIFSCTGTRNNAPQNFSRVKNRNVWFFQSNFFDKIQILS